MSKLGCRALRLRNISRTNGTLRRYAVEKFKQPNVRGDETFLVLPITELNVFQPAERQRRNKRLERLFFLRQRIIQAAHLAVVNLHFFPGGRLETAGGARL